MKNQRENEFKKKFKQLIRSATLLTTAYDAFSRANVDAQVLTNSSSEFDHVPMSSFSRSLIITYAKPFLSSKEIDATASMSKKYLFASEKFDISLHKALLELRNNFVAHANPSFEVSDARVYVTIANSDSGNPSVKRVYLPKALYYVSQGFLSLNKDPEMLERIEKHTRTAIELTHNEMNVQAEKIMNHMIEYADVSYLSEHVIIQEPTEPLPSDTEAFDLDSPKLKIGKIQSTNAFARVGMPIGSINFSNELFSITSEPDPKQDGAYKFNISFKNA